MFKPMLAATLKDPSKLVFPLLASQKLDGLRATVQGGKLLSRTLKPLPNCHVQNLFSGIPEGLDGEIIVGDPLASDAFRKTTSLVMSDYKPLDWFKGEQVRLHVFDKFGPEGFKDRILKADIARGGMEHVVIVPHIVIASIEALYAFEASMVSKGAEGVMVRSMNGPYKQNRSTENEGYLVKVKRFEDSEAEILGSFEMMHNDNAEETNELGRTKRSTSKEGLVPTGVLGGFNVRDLKTGVEFSVGSGFTADMKTEYWQIRDNLVGTLIKYKFFPSGGKDKPRHPIFLGFRDRRDV
jgi:DNA ligase-1